MKFIIVGCMVLVLCGFALIREKEIPVVAKAGFGSGEQIDYKVNFGFFTVGRAYTKIDNNFHSINGRTCFKVDAYGETSDWVSWLSKVRDNWGAYIDTASLETHQSYRKIREGRHKTDEIVDFDYHHKKLEVKSLDQKKGVYREPKSFDLPKDAKDIIGGFMFLRLIDFAKVKVGDTVAISGFLEDTFYKISIIYQGNDIVNTKVGRIPCLKLIPVMPDNKLFDGKNSVTCWISDDLNRVPVKIQAKMFIGSTGIEMVSFRGLKNQLKMKF